MDTQTELELSWDTKGRLPYRFHVTLPAAEAVRQGIRLINQGIKNVMVWKGLTQPARRTQ